MVKLYLSPLPHHPHHAVFFFLVLRASVSQRYVVCRRPPPQFEMAGGALRKQKWRAVSGLLEAPGGSPPPRLLLPGVTIKIHRFRKTAPIKYWALPFTSSRWKPAEGRIYGRAIEANWPLECPFSRNFPLGILSSSPGSTSTGYSVHLLRKRHSRTTMSRAAPRRVR